MPNTPESIDEIGIPKIVMKLSPLESIPTAVDATLSNIGEAAEAAAVGEALAELDEKIDSKSAETLYMDDTQTPTNTIAAKIEEITTALQEIAASAVAYGEGTVADALDAIDQDITGIKDNLYATEIPVSDSDDTPISEKLTTLQTGVGEAVKFSAQELTTAQKQQARTNIGAIGEGDISDVVRNTAQTMTVAQQETARGNIGAAADDVVLKKESQTISAELQGTIRSNIGALGAADAVLTSAQTLNSETQGIVRNNIGAVGTTDLTNAFSGLWLRRGYSYEFTNLAAGEVLGISRDNFGVETIDGYEVLTAGVIYCNNNNAAVIRWHSHGTATLVSIKNLSTTNAISGTVSLTLIYIRSGLQG